MGTVINTSATRIIIHIPPNFIPPKTLRRPSHDHTWFPVVSVFKPSNCTATNPPKMMNSSKQDNAIPRKPVVYNDNWFNRAAINYISQVLQDTTGMRNEETGYESLVVVSKAMFRSFDTIQQREVVVKALVNAIPKSYINRFKKFFPPSKFSREFCAWFTSIFFVWLVGSCEVKKSEFEGATEKNVVYIKKCRFLETSNCAGMCTNLCKVPAQEFMKNTLGMPITMVPNFEDMSCEYIFGEDPPALQDDPALNQPCYKLCDMKRAHDTSCIA